MNVKEFWKAVLEQNKEKLQDYFHEDAVIRWHCSNELFTVQEYIRANCEYPGEWGGEIERIEKTADIIEKSIARIPLYHGLHTIKTDTNNKTVSMITDEIRRL